MADSAAMRGSCGPEGDLLKLVLCGLCGGRTETANLISPWVTLAPEGSFHVYWVRSGACQLKLGRFSKPLPIQAGDIVILPHCTEHRLGDSSANDWSVSSQTGWFSESPRRKHHRTSDDHPRDAANVVVCRFQKPSSEFDHLIDKLPECVMFRRCGANSSHGPESILGVLENEVAQAYPSQQIVDHLMKAMILQAIRPMTKALTEQNPSEITTPPDRVIARAIGIMRTRPEISWTVSKLATMVGVSRSTFALRFSAQIGMTPLYYLRRERMQQAAELLCDKSLGIKEVAVRVGYRSESAFSNAFRQWFGAAPGLFRREQQS